MITTQTSASQAVSCAERRFPCRAGLRPIASSPQNRLWVISPKTGKELTIGDGFFPEIRERAPRLIGRIAQARAQGIAIVHLSIAELQALVDVQKLIAERCKPIPAGGLYRRYRRYRRRPWGC